jgi:hypothetical protein
MLEQSEGCYVETVWVLWILKSNSYTTYKGRICLGVPLCRKLYTLLFEPVECKGDDRRQIVCNELESASFPIILIMN